MGRRLVTLFAGSAVLGLAGYLAAGVYVYDRVSAIPQDCDTKWAGNTPASFQLEPALRRDYAEFDASPYWTAEFQAVTLPRRAPAITISGWFLAGPTADAPALVVVHGLGGCRRDQSVLIPAGMLHRHGFAALVIDLRDHGDSTHEDGRFAGGTEEYLDVLGAWDWLIQARGLPPERVGLFGVSLGAATVTIATGQEPAVAATWEDSGYAEIESATRDYLAYKGYPTFVAPAGPLVARILSGDDLTGPSPIETAGRLRGRPLYVTHGLADTTILPHQADLLVEAIRAAGGQVDPWLLPEGRHAQTMLAHPDEYERRLIEFFSGAIGSVS